MLPCSRLLVLLLLLALSLPCFAAGDTWADPARPYRVRVDVEGAPPGQAPVCGELRLDLGRDLERLGLPANVDRSSLRLVEVEAGGAARDVEAGVRGDALVWRVPGGGGVHRYELYFRAGASSGAGPAASIAVPDYATDTYGHGWEFSGDDFEAIDTWGDKPEYIRSRKVESGILKLDVTGDSYFIWGLMWGSGGKPNRPVSIDLARYSILEMRVRQSVPEANWRIMGRPGRGESLVQHNFRVSGTEWQTLRIDLRNEARWHGVLTALRIDPAKYVDAHVEFDWVRLLALVPAKRSAVEVLPKGPEAIRAIMQVESALPVAGSEQAVTVQVLGASGMPIRNYPVRAELAKAAGGVLTPTAQGVSLPGGGLRAITGSDGKVAFRYKASPKAGKDVELLTAVAEHSTAEPARVLVSPKAGPAARYVVTPLKPVLLERGAGPVAITARLADALGNPVPGGGRPLEWSAPGGRLVGPSDRTAADGSATASLRCDPATGWAVTVRVADASGLKGESAPVCVPNTAPRPDPVRVLPSGYFGIGSAAKARAWMPLGGFYANWVGTPSPDGEWNRLISFVDATDEETVAWLKLLKANGVTAQRFMLRAHRPNGMEPMDIGGRVNPGLYARLLHYFDLARPFGIRFQLVLHEDYVKPLYFDGDALEKFAAPWYVGQDLVKLPAFQRRFIGDRKLIDDIAQKYTDPDVIACQDQYTRQIVGLLKGHPMLFGYELENEMVSCPASWVNHQLQVIRSVDPTAPICVSHSGGGVFSGDPAWWRAKTQVDYYTPHLYPDPPSTQPAIDYGLAVDTLMAYARLASPAFLGESAGDQFGQHPDRDTRRWTMRDIIWFSLTNGAPGCFFWNARLSEVAEYRLANDITSQIDWTTFRRRPAPVVATVPHALENDQWFNTAEGRRAYDAMAAWSKLALDRGADLDFALSAPAGVKAVDGRMCESSTVLPADFGISPGFQLKPMVRQDGGEALLYVRSFAGVERWESTGDPRTTQYLRKRAAARLKVTVNLPGRFTAEIWDLDTRAHTTEPVSSGQEIDLGTTDHDFAVLLRRK